MPADIFVHIERLLQYSLDKNLITEWDVDFSRNCIIEVLGLSEYEQVDIPKEYLDSPVAILEKVLNWAAENGRLEENTFTYRDLLDTKIMSCLLPRPAEVIRNFYEEYEKQGAEKATQHFYQLSQDSHYIRTNRIAKNEHWYTHTDYGDIEITINLSKPEKDPIAIAAARAMKESSYPVCLLCKENVGYAGRVDHPARQNLRIIPVELTEENWYLQFSPYVYYNEHAIIFKGRHEPMKISKQTFERILEFIEKFPHYFLGSNADLPIVGGSILSHDHFQGGNHQFPMAKAEIEKECKFAAYPDILAGIVKWPMSVIRLQGKDRHEVSALAEHILTSWKEYNDETVGIQAFTGVTPHNTITPIAWRRDELFEMDLVLRNNRISQEHPMGIFHPHQEVHHIKKENIGLIEVMGLAVLPGRLKKELSMLAECLVSKSPLEEIKQNKEILKHYEWAASIMDKYPKLQREKILEALKKEVGLVFAEILEHAAVFKRDASGQQAFRRFIESISS